MVSAMVLFCILVAHKTFTQRKIKERQTKEHAAPTRVTRASGHRCQNFLWLGIHTDVFGGETEVEWKHRMEVSHVGGGQCKTEWKNFD